MTGSTRFSSSTGTISRRCFLVGAAAGLAGCQTAAGPASIGISQEARGYYATMYAALPNERFPIPAVDLTKFNAKYLRREVTYRTDEIDGTVIVDTSGPYLYFVRPDGKAIRYGIGVGREGFSWVGRAQILMRQKWPTWTPPAEMITRQPELEPYRKGMAPGLDNPLGARALYLFENGRDTLYRIHGTNEPWSIGKYVSSGCIRMLNQDVIDLYRRVSIGSSVVVLDQPKPRIG